MSLIRRYTTTARSCIPHFILLMSLPVMASASFTVDTYDDNTDTHPGDGVCKDLNGRCTLRAAIQEGEGGPGNAYTIDVPAGTYGLVYGQLRISKVATINTVNTASSSRTEVKCKSNKKFIAFSVKPWGTLVTHEVDISNCRVGLGIAKDAGAALWDSSLNGNERAISNSGSLRMLGGWMSGNSGPKPGSALDNYGKAELLGVFIENNHSDDRGGAIYNANSGIIHAQLGWFNNNSAGIAGGAIFNEGELSLDMIRLEGNHALAGGAIENASFSGKKPLISRCSFVKNEASGNIFDQCGGAIRQTKGDFFIANSTISGNMANGNGSALCTTNGRAHIGNVTITENISNRNSNEVDRDGGALFGHPDKGGVIVRNSIVANNLADGNGAADCAGKVKSEGHNIIGILDKDHCEFTEASNEILGTENNPVDAGLQPLDYKITAYHGLKEGSPAIDSADHTACMGEPHDVNEALSDQNEVPHDYSGTCDRGSIEYYR